MGFNSGFKGLKAPSNLADSDEYFRGNFCTMKMADSYTALSDTWETGVKAKKTHF